MRVNFNNQREDIFMTEQAFEGVRIIDLSEGIAGPYCTRLLGGYGADVIKVEKPGNGDRSRKAGPFPKDIPHPEKSALFLHLNINKKGITLNVETAAGREILQALVKRTDILVESFQPGRMSEWGLDYENLEKINPGLVMTAITPFGQTGPYRHYKESSTVLDALGGHTFIQGDPEREPLRYPEGTAEYTAGMFASVAVMGALLYSADTGKGQYIDIAILDCLPGLDAFRTAKWTHAGVIQQRTGGRYAAWPGKVYPCRDGYVGLCGVGPTGTMIPMYSVMEIPELLDPKYETHIQREELAKELDEIIQPWLREHDRYEIFHAMQGVRVQAGVCNSAEDLLKDPGHEARGFWEEVDHPAVGKLTYPGQPVRMTETAWQAGRAPMLGEHNEQIYQGELGYSTRDMMQLRASGVI
jgi:crotonobetainyl-CoA:carnitine CoA-transferase CaiB-like acyl-CoA transferase